MKDSEKLKIFTDAVKKAKEGDLFKFEEWLKNKGVNPSAFVLKYIFNYIRANPNQMIGNEQFIDKIGETIGYFLKDRSKTYHIAIIGAKGSGKTLLLNIIEQFANSIESNLGRRLDIFDFEVSLIGGHKIKADRIQSIMDSVIFIDDCDKTQDIRNTFEEVKNLRDNAVYITAWTPESWLKAKEIIKYLFPITEEFILTPIESGNSSVNFLNSICNAIMVKKEAPERLPKFIAGNHLLLSTKLQQYSSGNPLLTINLFLESIEETFLKNKDKLNAERIESVAKRMGLHGIQEKMENLSSQHLLILLELLDEKNKGGTRPMDLRNGFDLDKSTIAYHLKELKEKKELIEVEKVGKSSFYKVKNNLIPFIQQKIIDDKIKNK